MFCVVVQRGSYKGVLLTETRFHPGQEVRAELPLTTLSKTRAKEKTPKK